ncbi:MAG: NAD-dependent epimerase/dehydratase family protein [Acidobacteria bacterium]|nr:NAD-dependent epimerase/dehydratase family protein [Acidobacteriota bacterium]
MRVLVTGAHGCIGSWVVRQLLDRSIDTIAYDQSAEPRRLSLIATPDEVKRVELRTGAIEDTARVKALVRESGVTHIVHLAATLIPFCQANPVAGAMANVIGTMNVFEAARDAGREVRVVYASSAAVWGPPEAYGDRPLSEDDPLMPNTHYGVFKQANEGNAAVFHRLNGISSVGLRPWTVYGLGRDAGLTADPTIAAKAIVLKRPFRIRVTGKMDLQYVEDVAAAFIAALLAPLTGAHVFNLSGEIVDMRDLIGILQELRPGAGQLLGAEGPPVPVAHNMDGSRIHGLIPGIPHTPLRIGLERTLGHFERLEREGRLAREL